MPTIRKLILLFFLGFVTAVASADTEKLNDCSEYANCIDCTQQPNCGWSTKCELGTANGPMSGTTENWKWGNGQCNDQYMLSGTVSDARGMPIYRAYVFLSNESGVQAVDPTGENGMYVFYNIPRGMYRLGVYSSCRKSIEQDVVSITGDTRKNFNLPVVELQQVELLPSYTVAPGKKTIIDAHVIDTDGTLIETANISWSVDDLTVGNITDTGEFESLNTGRTQIHVTATCHGISKSASSTIEVRELFKIQGTVRDDHGLPLSGALVSIWKNDKLIQSTETGDGGAYILSDITEGNKIVAQKRCYAYIIDPIEINGNIQKNFILMQAPIARIDISPPSSLVDEGGKIEFIARAYDSNNRQMWPYFAWAVSDQSIGTISGSEGTGIFEGKKTGKADVRVAAACGGTAVNATAQASVSRDRFQLRRCNEADASTASKIDYVFIPDETYTNIEEFKNDVLTKYIPTLFSIYPLDAYKDKFNFYYIEEKAQCTKNGNNQNCILPPAATMSCPFADLKGVVHKRNSWRDYASLGNYFTMKNPMVQVHEMGHALFDFVDEYCCDAPYRVSTKFPYSNVFENALSCQEQLDSNNIPKQCKKICQDEDSGFPPCDVSCRQEQVITSTSVTSTTVSGIGMTTSTVSSRDTSTTVQGTSQCSCNCVNWYRQEGKSIMIDQSKTNKFSENNLLRIFWFFNNFARLSTSVQLVGTITDTKGNTVKEAYVNIVNENDASKSKSTYSDNNGNYLIGGIYPGIYTFIINGEATCRESALVKKIDLMKNMEKNFVLENIPISRGAINPTSAVVHEGETKLFRTALYNADNVPLDINADTIWDVGSNAVGSIENGKFKAKAPGSTSIQATITCGETTKTATANINVIP